MAGRGLEKLKKVSEKIIVPTDDILLYDRDQIDCRLIKFGKESTQTWKNDDGSTSISEHLRIYLRIYAIRRDKNSKVKQDDNVPQYGTINPPSKWLGELTAWSQKCEEAGDEDAIFKHRCTITRSDRQRTGAAGKYGYLEITNIVPDPTWVEDEPDNITSSSDEEKPVQSHPQTSNQTSNQKTSQGDTSEFDAALVELYSVADFDSLKSKAKSIGEKFPSQREKLVSAFESKKYDIAMNLVLGSTNPQEKALELSNSWYAKNPDKAASLQAYSSTLKKYDENEDLPF